MNGQTSSAAIVSLLKQTQKVLNEDGWIQGMLHSPEGHCLVGGLHLAAKQIDTKYEDTGKTLVLLGNTLTNMSGRHSGVGQWNDLKSTKRTHVDALIEESIERAITNGR